MFSVFIHRTNNTISAILNHKCNYVKIIYLRLHKRSYFKNSINRSWDKNNLDTFHRYPKEYKHFTLCRRYSTELHKINEIDMLENNYIPEHKILHSILEKSVHYQNSIMHPLKANVKVSYEEICGLYTTDWSCASMSHIYNAIKNISYCYLSGTRFETVLYDNILQACNDKLNELQNEQLKILMQHLIVISDESQKLCYWQPFLKTLNKQCLKRFFPSTVEQMLLIADAFYQLTDYNSYYMWRALRKIGTRPNKLSPQHLVQLLFLLNSSRSFYPTINMFEIECCAQECISDLSANEIGILARGFFLLKRKMRNKDLLLRVIKRVRQNVKFMESTTLASVMKLIRYTGCGNCLSEVEELMKSVHTEIPRLSLKCLTHIAHAFGGLRIYNEQLTKDILEKVKNELKTTRLKDIERILFAISSVAPYSDYYQETCQILLNEILANYQTTRSAEINKYPLSLVRVVTYITARNIYVPELIQHVLDPKYVQKVHKNSIKFMTNELFVVNCSIKIEFPDYKGPFLETQMYNYFIKKYLCTNDIDDKNSNVKFRTEILFICKRNLCIDVCVDYILPHYTVKDVVFGFDEHSNSVEIEPILSSMPIGSIKYVNTENLKNIRWNVLYPVSAVLRVIGRNDYVGSVYRKMKQLVAIGYTPIVIDEVEWNSCIGEKDKENYLRKLIYKKHNFRNLLNSNFEDCIPQKN